MCVTAMYSQVQSTLVVHWDNHALRLNAHHSVKQHAWNYFTQTPTIPA